MFGCIARQISRRVEAADRTAKLGEGFSGRSLRVGLAAEHSPADASTYEIASQPPKSGARRSRCRPDGTTCSRGLGRQGRTAS